MEGLEFLAIPEKMGGIDILTYQYFNQLLNHRTVIFNTGIDENIVELVYLPLRDFENDDSDEPVTLILNSSGGSVVDGFFLADYLTHYKKKLNIIITGNACSMAAVIISAGGKNENITRIAYPNTVLLLHQGMIELGASELKSAVETIKFADDIDERAKKFIIENTGMDEALYDSKARKQWYIFPEEAKELNLIDEIME